MDIQYQVRIRHVREALWRRGAGGASVMVGSGFSRHAVLREPCGKPPPTWLELSDIMRLRLTKSTERNCVKDSNPCPLMTAQTYCDEFGRAELHRFLRDQIGDEDIEPSELHERLLALPWVDVFSTNWDTLLERTQERIVSPHYEIVRARDELPLAARPRIVKLHGSLPAHFPLVTTLNDYNEYPQKFAPFVNTARQALMESVFLLIGFSGDDPNFRTWLQWVRNELDTSAPKIYLAGWLNLDQASIRELEKLGVALIDLAHHPNREQWQQQNMEHHFATEWLLASLEFGRSYPLEEWPKALEVSPSTVPSLLEPIDRSIWRAPRIPSALPQEDNDIVQETVDSVVETWKHNRALYPGWLVFPEQLRGELRSLSNAKISGDLFDALKEDKIIKVAEHFALTERIQIVFEVVWRREIRLEPIGDELAYFAKNTLRAVLSLCEDSFQFVFDRSAAICISLVLVTHARLNFDHTGFTEAIHVANKFAQNNKNARHRLSYEECLWAFYQNEFNLLRQRLSDWSVNSGDPYWVIRKSCLLFEIGHSTESILPLMRTAITNLRRSKKGSLDISVLSREAWAEFLVRWTAKQTWTEVEGSAPHRARAHDLVRFNCDPSSEIRALTIAIQARPVRQKGPGFELGEGERPRRLIEFEQVGFTAQHYKANAAYRIVRFAELVGLSRQFDPHPHFQTMLRHACEELHRDGQFELALRLLLRVAASSSDELIRVLLSRPNLAILPQTVVELIGDLCEKIIDEYEEFAQSSNARSKYILENRARIAVEILARVSLRFSCSRSTSAVRRGLAIYESPLFYKDILFREPMRDLFKWSWEAVPNNKKTELTFELLNAPIPGVDGYEPETFAFFEPVALIDGDVDAIPARNAKNEQLWNSTLTFLLRSLHFDKEAESRAILRIVQIALTKRLSQEERTKLASVLWDPDRDHNEEPIGHSVLRNWVYLLLPERETGSAEKWFRSKWLSNAVPSGGNDELLDDTMFQVGEVLAESRAHDFSFELSDDDCVLMQKNLCSWANAPIPEFLFSPFEQDRVDLLRNGILGVARLLMHLPPQDRLAAESLYKKFQNLCAKGIPAMPVLVGLLRSPDAPKSEILTELRKRLSSGSPTFVSDAALAIKFWLHSTDHCEISRTPTDLIREVGVIIATRRAYALSPALSAAEWIFTHGTSGDQQILRQLCLEGLAYLIRELDYEHEQNTDTDVPLLRWGCVSLAHAMKEKDIEEDIVENWLEVARTDPLPEVRLKVSQTDSQQFEDDKSLR